eukprot:3053331-Amphidinium_carterae.1
MDSKYIQQCLASDAALVPHLAGILRSGGLHRSIAKVGGSAEERFAPSKTWDSRLRSVHWHLLNRSSSAKMWWQSTDW